MYIILSNENWTEVTYPVIQSGYNLFIRACFAIFFVGWFIVSWFIVLNMFVAVISENLGVSSEFKRAEQVKVFVKEYAASSSRTGGLTRALSSVKNYMWSKVGNGKKEDSATQSDEAVFHLLLEKRIVEEVLDKNDLAHMSDR